MQEEMLKTNIYKYLFSNYLDFQETKGLKNQTLLEKGDLSEEQYIINKFESIFTGNTLGFKLIDWNVPSLIGESRKQFFHPHLKKAYEWELKRTDEDYNFKNKACHILLCSGSKPYSKSERVSKLLQIYKSKEELFDVVFWSTYPSSLLLEKEYPIRYYHWNTAKANKKLFLINWLYSLIKIHRMFKLLKKRKYKCIYVDVWAGKHTKLKSKILSLLLKTKVVFTINEKAIKEYLQENPTEIVNYLNSKAIIEIVSKQNKKV